MWIEEFILGILKDVAEKGLWSQVVALDLETKILNLDDFLTGERILGVSLAKRKTTGEIEQKSLVLEQDNNVKEFELIKTTSDIVKSWNPLVIVGYGCRDYDLPLLAFKKQKAKLQEIYLWGISDILNASAHIELAELSKYILTKKYNEKQRYRSMLEIMKHKHFNDLPFKLSKEVFTPSRKGKGIDIYKNWKEKNDKFMKYLSGEAYDQLLIAERIRDTEF